MSEHIVLNYRGNRTAADQIAILKHQQLDPTDVTVDGKVIRLVCFVDTAAGVVKTYNVFGDGHARSDARESHRRLDRDGAGPLRDVTLRWKSEDFPGREVECPIDDVICETLRGKVQIVDRATGKLLYGDPT